MSRARFGSQSLLPGNRDDPGRSTDLRDKHPMLSGSGVAQRFKQQRQVLRPIRIADPEPYVDPRIAVNDGAHGHRHVRRFIVSDGIGPGRVRRDETAFAVAQRYLVMPRAMRV